MKAALLLVALHLEPSGRFQGNPCTPTETWTFAPEITEELRPTLDSKAPPVETFSDALALRSRSYTAGARTLAEYFISRSLFQASLPHVARMGFSVTLKRPPTAETQPAQLAAMACLSWATV